MCDQGKPVARSSATFAAIWVSSSAMPAARSARCAIRLGSVTGQYWLTDSRESSRVDVSRARCPPVRPQGLDTLNRLVCLGAGSVRALVPPPAYNRADAQPDPAPPVLLDGLVEGVLIQCVPRGVRAQS